MMSAIQIIHQSIIVILVREEVGDLNVASIGISTIKNQL